MKKIAVILIAAILALTVATSSVLAYSEPTEEWNQTFGGSGWHYGYSVQQTSDGGYIITGITHSYEAGNSDVWLIKTDSDGNKEWDKTFGGSKNDWGYSVQQTSDSGYIITGYTDSFGAGLGDVWLIKTNSSGIEEWSQTLGSSDHEWGASVQQTSDGGYIVTGSVSIDCCEDAVDMLLIKTDPDGNEEWNQTFGGSYVDASYSVQQTSDNGYVITGYTLSYGAGNSDVWLIKTDPDGNKLWDKTFGSSKGDSGRSVQQTYDGGYIITGGTNSFGDSICDVWLIKTDSDGTEEWKQTFGSSDYYDEGYSVQQTSDGGYILTGSTRSYGEDESDMWLIRTDPDGNKLWDKTFGGSEEDAGRSVQQTSDGGYIVTGVTRSYAAGYTDVWLVKVRGEASKTPNITSINPNSGNQGATLDVTITGTNFTEATSVSFGTGITATFTVDSATQITASITIDAGAATGSRDVSVTIAGGTGTLSSVFTVNESPIELAENSSLYIALISIFGGICIILMGIIYLIRIYYY